MSRFRGYSAHDVLAVSLLLSTLTGCTHLEDHAFSRELTSVADIRRLDPQSLTVPVPARITGQVTYVDGLRSLFLQDKSGAVLVWDPNVDVELKTGQRIEVTGDVTRSQSTPAMKGLSVRILDASPALPTANPVTAEDLSSTRMQYRYVQMRGIVRSAAEDQESHARVALTLSGYGREIGVTVRDTAGEDPHPLEDATVAVRGVLCISADAVGKPISIKLAVQSIGDISLLEAAPRVDSVPIQTVDQVLHYSQGSLPEHRIRMRGTIRVGGAGFIFQDFTGTLPLSPDRASGLKPAPTVELLAFVADEDGSPGLIDAQTAAAAGSESFRTSSIPATVQQVRQLTDQQISRNPRVHLTGVVTYSDPSVRDTFIQDATGGIFVFAPKGGKLSLKKGQLIDLKGFASFGGFGPVITEPKVKVLGERPLPRPVAIDMEQLFTGATDSELVEASGIVRSVRPEAGHLRLEMVWGSHRFLASVAGTTQTPPWLMNSRVKMIGVCGAVSNFKHQILGVELNIPDIASIKPDGKQSSGTLPLQNIDHLLQYSDQLAAEDRSRVQGSVIFSSPNGPTYLTDYTGSVMIRTHNPISLQVGDWVEASGTTRAGSFAPFLEDAELLKLESLKPPKPHVVTADTLLDRGIEAEFIQMDGYLVSDSSGSGEQTLFLQAGDRIFEAQLLRGRLPALSKGSLLSITGITDLRVDESAQVLAPNGFSILLRSPADITVLKTAPWWTAERMGYAVLGGVTVVAAAFAWIFILRRRVRLQTADLEKAKNAAEQASRIKSEFLANMSHEIRTPMNGVLGLTELVLDSDLSEEQREYLSEVKQSGESLLEIINDILDFSKMEAGKLSLDPIPFSLRQSIIQDLRSIAIRAQQKDLELVHEVSDPVPDTLIGDPGRLRQILLNLLSNAIKFTKTGEVALSVSLDSRLDEKVKLHFVVRDTGIGIPREKHQLVFDSFSQADGSTTRRYGGTGLGLSICKQLVALMNGRIWIESAEGRGTCFHFTADFVVDRDAERALPVPMQRDALGELNLLMVDDNATNCRIISEYLSKQGIRHQVAGTGAAGLDYLSSESFDVLLVDTDMPGMNGFELCDEIRKRWPNLSMQTVLLSSIYKRGPDAQRDHLRFANSLSKPLYNVELLEVLVKLTRASRSDKIALDGLQQKFTPVTSVKG